MAERDDVAVLELLQDLGEAGEGQRQCKAGQGWTGHLHCCQLRLS